MALTFTGLGASAIELGRSRDQLWHWHIKFGYFLTLSLLLRLIWGLWGPRFALFKDFLDHFSYLKNAKPRISQTQQEGQRFTKFGHDSKAAILYLLVYLGLIVLSLSGLMLAGLEHNKGPFATFTFDRLFLREWFSIPHTLINYLILSFTALHIIALFWHQKKRNLPMIQSMFNGIQCRFKKDKT
jgi:cytochrome b